MARTRTKGTPSPRRSERNAAIHDDYVSGCKSVAELAREWKVIEARIRQIVAAERKMRAVSR